MRKLFESRAAVLEYEAKQRLIEKEIELEKVKQQRKPLTDEQRSWIVATCPTPRHIIDTVEKMHAIKE